MYKTGTLAFTQLMLNIPKDINSKKKKKKKNNDLNIITYKL